MKIQPIQMSDFSLVEIYKDTPHCKLHGAMNKVSLHKDGGGYWRCITIYGTTREGREVEGICRAGCLEIKDNQQG